MARLSALYATALFDLIEEGGAENEALEQIGLVRGALSEAESKRVLVHPHIHPAEKKEFFSKAFKGQLQEHLMSLLYLTIDKNREAYFLPALSELKLMIERKQRKTTAKVTSAEELSKKRIAALKKLLEAKLSKQVEIITKVDPSALGGSYIQVDGYFIDRTVKRRLKDMTADIKDGRGGTQ
ncbi:MAG: ATP synthase F1 subunit delta [Oscillospiraceae bacterium]|jgi:F-type H+-transporting ATPase subunit delta|nr:ATP synthase F1 subunit delta [Oscillospiraceae bacterium]